MTTDQLLILVILAASVAMFVWGRWRHDMVAVGALLAAVLVGLVPAFDAFAGFGHPAVITVGCVLVLSHGLHSSGAVDVLARAVMPTDAGPTLTIAALTALAALLSGFMNNVGALALLMPLALQVASRQQMPPSRVLMPLAFGSILGGMTTLIGTPPNLIVSGFRAQTGMGSFGMFDFTPVGLAVAAGGVLFVALIGWRLVPARERAGAENFETAAYLTEARVREDSKAVDMTLGEVEAALEQAGAQIVGLVRNEVRVTAPSVGRRVHAGDILVIEAEAESLSEALVGLGLKLEESRRPPKVDPDKGEEGRAGQAGDTQEDRRASKNDARAVPKARKGDKGGKADEDEQAEQGEKGEEGEEGEKDEKDEKDEKRSEDQKAREREEIVLAELAVLPGSTLVGRSSTDVQLRTRHGINLLALSRHGTRSTARLRTMPIQAGDVLLMQGPPETLMNFASASGCVPLAERALRIPNKRKAIISSVIMLLAIGGAALGLVPAAISFAAGVLASMALRTVPPRAVYDAIDWPVIVLLAALIPVAGAMQATGTADLIAAALLDTVAQGHPVLALGLVLVVTMFLSDLMNNAATAAVMCPVALGTASQLGASPDSFLMAVAIGASCAFLTPIGHQNNTLILGPGGLRFGDYWRLGVPLEIIVLAISIPLLLVVWPL